MGMHEILAARSDEVMERWKAIVRGAPGVQDVPPMELVDHLPRFVDEIIACLRARAGAPRDAATDAPARSAGHGRQRLRLGFSLDAVVREYGALRQAIVETATAAGVTPTLDELQVVFDTVIDGIAHAVLEYTHARDAELARQANEHFAFVAHELRNPLGSARLAFELLKRQKLVPTEGPAVRALERGLSQTSELIQTTLRITRMASGIELRRQPTTLRALVEDAELGALPEAQSKGVQLRTSVAHDREVRLDRRLVASALDNLVRNGVKYTPEGGSVEIRARDAGARVLLEVEDRCGGMAPGQAEAVFAPFVRFDAQQRGFGLGLAIARQAVDAHGGSLRVENHPGTGCVFVIELPVVEEDAAAGESEP